MKFCDLCGAVYPSCAQMKSQKRYMEEFFKAAGGSADISDSYKKGLFNGDKPFSENLKELVRGRDNICSLSNFFENQITDVSAVIVALGIPEKGEPNLKALSFALAKQSKEIIESSDEDVQDILIMEYQQAKICGEDENERVILKPLYPGDSVSVFHDSVHIIQSFDQVNHVWELVNVGKIPWEGRKLVYKRGPKDRPEARPDVIPIPDLQPNERTKIATTIDGRGFDGITQCVWVMEDSDGENCFPKREKLFCVTIDAKYKRN